MNVVKIFKVTREWICLAALLTATCCFAQSDPGPRGGAPGAGTAIGGLTPGELDFFNTHGVPQFSQVEAVADGLGPRFNLDSCGGCHIQPALGGSSPAINPQLASASTMAPGNTVPSFITANGPVREARFIRKGTGVRTVECMIFSPLLGALISQQAVPFSNQILRDSKPTTT
jgi:hypothetical protein